MMIIDVVKHALMITGFVFMMMLVIEYLNVLSKGDWQSKLRTHRWRQYFIASFLGATPGCLGAFAVVSLYIHRVITIGALTAAMIATSGDESFVMLALFPGQALLLFVILFFLGIACGVVVDMFAGRRKTPKDNADIGLAIHEEEPCICFAKSQILAQWRHCSAHRGMLALFFVLFLLGLLSGEVGPAAWGWIRGTLVLATSLGLFIVATVPDHFLEQHLWEHIAKKHIGRIFLWTLGALLVMHVLLNHLHLEAWIKESNLIILVIACLVGIIPASGPHLIFVTLFAGGSIPFSILLASSIVQDGHGMLPLLAHSRRDFIAVKAVNVAIGLIAGLTGYAMGW